MIKQLQNFLDLHKVRSNTDAFLVFQFTQAQGLISYLKDKNNTTTFHVFDTDDECIDFLIDLVNHNIDSPVSYCIPDDLVSIEVKLINENIYISEFVELLESMSVQNKITLSFVLSLIVDSCNVTLSQMDMAIRENNRKKAMQDEN